MLTVAILAGGLASRLGSLSSNNPKALVSVAGKPFIFHQLNFLKLQGIKKVVICVGHLGEIIENVVGDGSFFNLDIKYSYDGPFLLGTGGAIKKALMLLGNNFYILYGDTYLKINFSEIEDLFFRKSFPALMTIYKNKNIFDKSNVFYNSGIIYEYNKNFPNESMEFIDYGVSIVNAEIFDNYELDKNFDISDVFNYLSINNKLAGYEAHEQFYEIGSLPGLKLAESHLSQLFNQKDRI